MPPHRPQLNHLALGVGPIVNEGRKGREISNGAAERRLEHEQLIVALDFDPNVPALALERQWLFDKIHAAHATALSETGPSKAIPRSYRAAVNGTGFNHKPISRQANPGVHHAAKGGSGFNLLTPAHTSHTQRLPCALRGAGWRPRLAPPINDNDWHPLGGVA